jgi:hypothetical protein
MRVTILALFLSIPGYAFAQDDGTCTTIATIQSQQCTVRRVVVCDNNPVEWRNVAIYGPNGPTSMSIFNADGVQLRSGSGPGTPQTRLGDQADPVDLPKVFQTGADTFDYLLTHDDSGPTRLNGKMRSTGETVTIDGRSLIALVARQTITPDAGEPMTVDVNYFYDADLQLLITDSVRDATTGEFKQHRTPVDFILPGESGFEDYVPLYGCED